MIREIADGVWEHERFIRLGIVKLPRRMTIVRLDDGSLLLHSVNGLDEAGYAELDALGPVRHIVAPNCFHHFWVDRFAERYPDARVYGAPGLAEKRKDLVLHETLSATPPEAWAGQLDHALLEGSPRLNEVALFHRASRTAILTDLAFNIHGDQPFSTRCVMRINGCYGKLGTSRVFRFLAGDKNGVWKVGQRILEWDLERVTVAHGSICDQDAKAKLAASFERFRPA